MFKVGDRVRNISTGYCKEFGDAGDSVKLGYVMTVNSTTVGVLFDHCRDVLTCDKLDVALVADKVDYNDGNWHGWTGGECPVDPDSVVNVCFRGCGEAELSVSASNWNWGRGRFISGGDIVAFRVVKPAQPAEYWIVTVSNKPYVFTSKPQAEQFAYGIEETVTHVRAVTD